MKVKTDKDEQHALPMARHENQHVHNTIRTNREKTLEHAPADPELLDLRPARSTTELLHDVGSHSSFPTTPTAFIATPVSKPTPNDAAAYAERAAKELALAAPIFDEDRTNAPSREAKDSLLALAPANVEDDLASRTHHPGQQSGSSMINSWGQGQSTTAVRPPVVVGAQAIMQEISGGMTTDSATITSTGEHEGTSYNSSDLVIAVIVDREADIANYIQNAQAQILAGAPAATIVDEAALKRRRKGYLIAGLMLIIVFGVAGGVLGGLLGTIYSVPGTENPSAAPSFSSFPSAKAFFST